jgi:hypothetical protein
MNPVKSGHQNASSRGCTAKINGQEMSKKIAACGRPFMEIDGFYIQIRLGEGL